MPLNNNIECTGSGKRHIVTLKDAEELLVFARAQGATDEYEIGVDAIIEFKSPIRINRMVVQPPQD
jgi:hypothetical protein